MMQYAEDLLTDVRGLADVSPDELKAFLTAKGWSEAQLFEDRGARWVWRSDGKEKYVLVPYDRRLDDYAERLRDVVRAVAEVEARTAIFAAEELTHTGADLIHIAVPADPTDDSVPLEAGTRLVAAARDLVLASALAAAASEPQPAFGRGRRPAQASEFMERMRLAQPSRGSFVVTLTAPVETSLDLDDGQGHVGTFSRRTVETMARSLSLVVERAVDSPQRVADEDAIAAGVNANLLAALGAMLGDAEHPSPVTVSFSWSPSVPIAASVPTQVTVPPEARTVLLDAATLLRSRAPVYDVTIEGPVTTLTKEGPRFGKATVKTALLDALRFIEVELDEADYDRAIDAHRDDLYVRVVGDVDRTGQRWRIRRPASFELLAQSEAPTGPPSLLED